MMVLLVLFILMFLFVLLVLMVLMVLIVLIVLFVLLVLIVLSEPLLQLDGSEDSDGVSLVQHQLVDSVSVRIQADSQIPDPGLQVRTMKLNLMELNEIIIINEPLKS